MSVTKPTLTYFDICGRAEVARLILEDAGVDYTHVPVLDWPARKLQLVAAGKLSFGQIPLFEDRAVTLVQSGSIARYLGRKYGYSGANEVEAALVDVAYEGVNDFYGSFVTYFFGTEDSKKPAVLSNILNNVAPVQLSLLSALLEKNGRNGFLVGNKVSYADLALYNTVNALLAVEGGEALLASYPLVKAHHRGVSQRERIRAYTARDVYKKSAL